MTGNILYSSSTSTYFFRSTHITSLKTSETVAEGELA